MKTTHILRTLGALAILGAGVSFLFEGWANLTGISKYVLFFSFVSALYVGSLITKAESISRTLSGLFITLSAALFAQLGSFILDQSDRIPDEALIYSPVKLQHGSPITLLSVTSILLLIPMLRSAFKKLNEGHATSDTIFYVASGLIMLIPFRDSWFSLSGSATLLFLLFLDIQWKKEVWRYFQYSHLVKLTFILFFLGRSSLYEVDLVFGGYLIGLLSLFFLIVLPALLSDKDSRLVSSFVAYLLMMISTRMILSGLELNDSIFVFLAMASVLTVSIILSRESAEIGLGFLAFLVWFNIVLSFLGFNVGYIPSFASFIVPICILTLSLSLKKKSGFFSGSSLLIATIMIHLLKIIKIPETNIWMLLGAAGLILFALGGLIDRYKDVVGAKYKNLMNELE